MGTTAQTDARVLSVELVAVIELPSGSVAGLGVIQPTSLTRLAGLPYILYASCDRSALAQARRHDRLIRHGWSERLTALAIAESRCGAKSLISAPLILWAGPG